MRPMLTRFMRIETSGTKVRVAFPPALVRTAHLIPSLSESGEDSTVRTLRGDKDMREAFEEMLRQYQPAPLNVYIYGDATGEQRKTSASRTDWQIVKDFFGRYTDRF